MATGKIDGLNCLTVDKKMIYIKSEAKPILQIFIHSSAKEVPDCVCSRSKCSIPNWAV